MLFDGLLFDPDIVLREDLDISADETPLSSREVSARTRLFKVLVETARPEARIRDRYGACLGVTLEEVVRLVELAQSQPIRDVGQASLVLLGLVIDERTEARAEQSAV